MLAPASETSVTGAFLPLYHILFSFNVSVSVAELRIVFVGINFLFPFSQLKTLVAHWWILRHTIVLPITGQLKMSVFV